MACGGGRYRHSGQAPGLESLKMIEKNKIKPEAKFRKREIDQNPKPTKQINEIVVN